MITIRYVIGDATAPLSTPAIIAHVCNDLGAWGRGFVLALSRRWPQLPELYRQHLAAFPTHPLGSVQFLTVEPDLQVANMIAQHGIRPSASGPPIRYAALRQCLTAVATQARLSNATVHLPRIGCGLAGGTWDRVGPLIVETLSVHDIPVVVYDLGLRPAPPTPPDPSLHRSTL